MNVKTKLPKKFANVGDVAFVESSDEMSPSDLEKSSGQQILWNWVNIARWYFPDEDVADILEKHAARLRE